MCQFQIGCQNNGTDVKMWVKVGVYVKGVSKIQRMSKHNDGLTNRNKTLKA
jgi:hypothetical protein